MTPELAGDVHVPTDPEEQRIIHEEVLRIWLRTAPGGGDEVRYQTRRELMLLLFERRLGRRLRAAEQGVLRERFSMLGFDRLAHVVLELDANRLAAWLADRDAR